MGQIDSFACPYCDRQYRFKPELEGKRVRCKCGEKFTIEAPVADEPEDYDLDVGAGDDGGPDWSALLGSDESTPVAAPAEPAGATCPNCHNPVKPGAALCVKCGTDLKSGKQRNPTKVSQPFSAVHETAGSAVRTKITGAGLLTHGIGFLLFMLGGVLAGIGGMMVTRGNDTGNVLAMIGGICVLVGMPMVFIGPFLGLAAPADAGRALLIASILCLIGAVVMSVMIEMGKLPAWMDIIQNVPMLVGAGCFLGFLQKLSVFLDDDQLYERSQFLLKLFFGIMILTVALFIPILGCFAALGVLIAQIVFAFAYTGTVCQAGLAAIKS